MGQITQWSNVVQGNLIDPAAGQPQFPWNAIRLVGFQNDFARIELSGTTSIEPGRINTVTVQSSRTADFQVVLSETTIDSVDFVFSQDNIETYCTINPTAFGRWYFRASANID